MASARQVTDPAGASDRSGDDQGDESSGPAGPVPIKRVSAVEALAEELRRRILNGGLAPGDYLREIDIASAYSVGRYTVRAAFQRLVHSGLAVSERNRGVSVLQPTGAVARDVYAVRRAIEVEAAYMLVEQGRSLDWVREAVARLQELASDVPLDQLIEADLDVHRAIVASTGSSRMTLAFEETLDQVRLLLRSYPPDQLETVRATVRDQHVGILRELEGDDPQRAADAIRSHQREAIAIHDAPTPMEG